MSASETEPAGRACNWKFDHAQITPTWICLQIGCVFGDFKNATSSRILQQESPHRVVVAMRKVPGKVLCRLLFLDGFPNAQA